MYMFEHLQQGSKVAHLCHCLRYHQYLRHRHANDEQRARLQADSSPRTRLQADPAPRARLQAD